ncbi:hypothetical protein ACKWMY_28175, partial [Serratia sp. J2]
TLLYINHPDTTIFNFFAPKDVRVMGFGMNDWKSVEVEGKQLTIYTGITELPSVSISTGKASRIDVDYSNDERGVLLFEAAVSALEKNKGKYRWLKDRENIRISKKRIEEAHQNNAGYGTPPAETSPPENFFQPAAPSYPEQTHYTENSTYDDWHQNFAPDAFTDDFASSSVIDRI